MGRLDEAIEKALKSRQDQAPSPPGPEVAVAVEPVEKTAPALANRKQEERPREKWPPSIITREANFMAYEGFARLKVSILRMAAAENKCFSILVTSPSMGEGKSLTSLNLAVSIAKSYDHTSLLIDADMRKPSLHNLLGVAPKPGLLQLLKGEATFDEVTVKTGIGMLDFIPAGGSIANPVEFLSSSRTKSVLDEIFTRYPDRFVTIDSPPLVPFAETQTLAHLVDGVVLVARHGVTSIESVQKAVSILRNDKVLGMVLNASQGVANSENFGMAGTYYEYGAGGGE